MVAFDEIFSGVTTFITIRQISAREWQKKTAESQKFISFCWCDVQSGFKNKI